MWEIEEMGLLGGLTPSLKPSGGKKPDPRTDPDRVYQRRLALAGRITHNTPKKLGFVHDLLSPAK